MCATRACTHRKKQDISLHHTNFRQISQRTPNRSLLFYQKKKTAPAIFVHIKFVWHLHFNIILHKTQHFYWFFWKNMKLIRLFFLYLAFAAIRHPKFLRFEPFIRAEKTNKNHKKWAKLKKKMINFQKNGEKGKSLLKKYQNLR